MRDRVLLTRKHRLSRILGISFAAFGLLSSLALAVWMNAWHLRLSTAAYQELAETNAAFVSQLRLPRSPELAQRLSTILDSCAAFHFAGQEDGNWPPLLRQPIAALVAEQRPASRRTAGYEIAAAPLGDPGVHLVLFRHLQGIDSAFPRMVLIPSLALAAACGGLAFALARGIASPLEQLTGWLPNLDAATSAPEPLSPAVLRRPDEIGTLAAALVETANRLRREQELRHRSERLAMLGRIATSLAHEIKNPAAAIALHADLLAGILAESQQQSVRLIRDEVDQITGLVNQWLFVARPEPPRSQPQNLRQLLARVASRIRPLLEHAGATLELQKEGPAAVLKGDAPRLEQALRNLLINASQAMPLGGTIRTGIQVTSSCLELWIEDEGPGFSREALSRFGEPFFSEREGGMGIGLTLAREVLLAHGGSIHAANLPERGARLVCRFPRIDNLPVPS